MIREPAVHGFWKVFTSHILISFQLKSQVLPLLPEFFMKGMRCGGGDGVNIKL
jgi:hypothetical protein